MQAPLHAACPTSPGVEQLKQYGSYKNRGVYEANFGRFTGAKP